MKNRKQINQVIHEKLSCTQARRAIVIKSEINEVKIKFKKKIAKKIV